MLPDHDVKGRRSGKQLRNVASIVADEEGGMLGRVMTFLEHIFEGPTNYTAVGCLR